MRGRREAPKPRGHAPAVNAQTWSPDRQDAAAGYGQRDHFVKERGSFLEVSLRLCTGPAAEWGHVHTNTSANVPHSSLTPATNNPGNHQQRNHVWSGHEWKPDTRQIPLKYAHRKCPLSPGTADQWERLPWAGGREG